MTKKPNDLEHILFEDKTISGSLYPAQKKALVKIVQTLIERARHEAILEEGINCHKHCEEARKQERERCVGIVENKFRHWDYDSIRRTIKSLIQEIRSGEK